MSCGRFLLERQESRGKKQDSIVVGWGDLGFGDLNKDNHENQDNHDNPKRKRELRSLMSRDEKLEARG